MSDDREDNATEADGPEPDAPDDTSPDHESMTPREHAEARMQPLPGSLVIETEAEGEGGAKSMKAADRGPFDPDALAAGRDRVHALIAEYGARFRADAERLRDELTPKESKALGITAALIESDPIDPASLIGSSIADEVTRRLLAGIEVKALGNGGDPLPGLRGDPDGPGGPNPRADGDVRPPAPPGGSAAAAPADAATKALAAGAVAKVASWLTGLKAGLNKLLTAAAIALGGERAGETKALQAAIEKQEAFADGFATDILNGDQPLDGTLAARAEQYSSSAWQTAEMSLSELASADGLTEVARILDGLASHCSACPELAARGYVPIDSDEFVGIGETPCGGRCRCSLEFR